MRQFKNNEKMEQERIKKERGREEKVAEWIKKKEEEIKGYQIDYIDYL